MHFLQSENRAAGHAPLLPTLEANKNNIRENKNTRLGFLLPSLLLICLKLQDLNNVGLLHTDIIKWHTSAVTKLDK